MLFQMINVSNSGLVNALLGKRVAAGLKTLRSRRIENGDQNETKPGVGHRV